MMDYGEKMRQYIEALEEERRKIEVFHRELPLSMQLVSQAIDSCRQQMAAMERSILPSRNSECEEASSDQGQPVLEEFMPLKPSSSSDQEEEDKISNEIITNDKAGKKADWLKSVPLWNQDPPPAADHEDSSRKSSTAAAGGGGAAIKVGGAFHPYNGDNKKMSGTVTAAASSSTAETGGRRDKKKQGQSHRKSRRCWSPELHRKFLDALKHLGGPHAATPKQIRELMKVDGLTNDEVKSHLQKYRLHTRRPSPAIQSSGSSNTQPPQFLVVGGIWVPKHDSRTAAQPPAGPTANGVYALLPTLPQISPISLHQDGKQTAVTGTSMQWDGSGSPEEAHVNSSSPTTSSSSHTATTSPAF